MRVWLTLHALQRQFSMLLWLLVRQLNVPLYTAEGRTKGQKL